MALKENERMYTDGQGAQTDCEDFIFCLHSDSPQWRKTRGKYIQIKLLTKLVSLIVQRGPVLPFWLLRQGFLALVE